jgi:hypothetical protein
MASRGGAPDRTGGPGGDPAVHRERPRLAAASKHLPLADDLGQGTLVKVY